MHQLYLVVYITYLDIWYLSNYPSFASDLMFVLNPVDSCYPAATAETGITGHANAS
jgi:hypothetical protein